MDGKPQIDLSDVFDQSDRRIFLRKFEFLIRHLSREQSDCCRHSGGQCHDINQIVTLITDNLIKLVAKNESKFEALLYSLPWTKYLFETGHNINRLNSETFAKLWLEYVQIFPNKSDKFVESFLFILRGSKDAGDDTTMSAEEIHLFSVLKSAIETLLKSIRNFEAVLVAALKKRFPFYHNTNVHEFVCYTYNLVQICELLTDESYFVMYNFLFTQMLQSDIKQFFDEVNDAVNKENILFEFEFEDTSATPAPTSQTTATTDERLKKFKVLDASFNLLFEYIDSQLEDGGKNADRLLEALISIFFQRLLVGSSIHLQYLAFYLCARSRKCCDAFVNDLWTIATSGAESLQVREGSFSFLISLILSAQFVSINTVFSFLKILLQSMNEYLDTKLATSDFDSNSSDRDIMYYNFCIGFCQLFCAFNTNLERIQIECLKSMDLKRALMNTQCNPVHFFPCELREYFLSLASHYRIGYVNVHEIRPKSLAKMSAAHRDNPPRFGQVKLAAVKARILPFVNSIDVISADACNSFWRMNSPTAGNLLTNYSSKTIAMTPDTSRYSTTKSRFMLATSPTTNTSGDDGMLSSPNSFTPSSNIMMAHMLSDIEAME